jgi:putative FmdB family regulatory protein
MPLYEYQCDACGRRFELIRKFSDPPLEKCPTCGGAVQKLVSSPAFQFKGTGFYITDYGKKEQAPPPQSDEARADAAASKEKDKGGKDGEKDGEKSGGEKGDKGGKSDAGEKGTKSDQAPAAAPAPKAPAKSPA